MKKYLGDGVYVELVYGGLKLTTSDGIEDTNTIFFEPEVLDAFLSYCDGLPSKSLGATKEEEEPPSPMDRTMPR